MAKKKQSESQKMQSTRYKLEAMDNRNKRLARHLKKHPNDKQSAAQVGKLTVRGAKKRVGKKQLLTFEYVTTENGKKYTHTKTVYTNRLYWVVESKANSLRKALETAPKNKDKLNALYSGDLGSYLF